MHIHTRARTRTHTRTNARKSSHAGGGGRGAALSLAYAPYSHRPWASHMATPSSVYPGSAGLLGNPNAQVPHTHTGYCRQRQGRAGSRPALEVQGAWGPLDRGGTHGTHAQTTLHTRARKGCPIRAHAHSYPLPVHLRAPKGTPQTRTHRDNAADVDIQGPSVTGGELPTTMRWEALLLLALAGAGLAVRLTPCSVKDCTSGKCLYEDCQEPVGCRGGICTFVGCVNPSCQGGGCVFRSCTNPSCNGGKCEFFDTQTTLSTGYCSGGACRFAVCGECAGVWVRLCVLACVHGCIGWVRGEEEGGGGGCRWVGEQRAHWRWQPAHWRCFPAAGFVGAFWFHWCGLGWSLVVCWPLGCGEGALDLACCSLLRGRLDPSRVVSPGMCTVDGYEWNSNVELAF
jgi:hypothetical protein